MADFVFNIAKGKVAAYAQRVKDGDPADSRLLVIPFNSTATDATLRDLDTLSAIEADANTAEEVTWGRKTLQAADITITVDDTNDRVDVDITDQTWTAIAAGNDVTDLLIAYIPDGNATGGVSADTAVVPLTWHDFVVTTDGSDVTAVINTAGFFRAS